LRRPAAPESSAIEISDAAGRRVKLGHIPQRIVVVGRLPFTVLHLLYAFPEGRQRVVGSENKGISTNDFLPIVDPSFTGKTRFKPESQCGANRDFEA